MKILYGIQSNGNGHITRSLELINKLTLIGHKVDVITSGCNSDLDLNLKKKDFTGLTIYYNKTGSLDWLKTLKKLKVKQLIKDINLDVSEYNLVISDFEPISAWSSKKCGIKSIGISNQYSLLSDKVLKKKNFISQQFIKNFAPCDEYIGLNYQKFDDFIYQPIISNELSNSNVISDENFLLIYLPSYSLDFILEQIKNIDSKFKIYSNEKCNKFHSNIEIKKLDTISFKHDILRCSGVITACGFSTTTEALVLGKKLWAIPLKYQYEQISNSLILKDLGVFTDSFNKSNLKFWINIYNKIDYKWDNPIKDIIFKINQSI